MLRRGDTLVVKSLDRLSRNKADIKNELTYFNLCEADNSEIMWTCFKGRSKSEPSIKGQYKSRFLASNTRAANNQRLVHRHPNCRKNQKRDQVEAGSSQDRPQGKGYISLNNSYKCCLDNLQQKSPLL